MTKYFKFFPKVEYDGRMVTDITRRVSISEDIIMDPYAFLPFTVKEEDRPEDVAYYYYGSMDKVWLIYLANNIIDPYTQWVMPTDQFLGYIQKKYAEQSGLTGYDVVAWSQDMTSNTNILYYQNNDDPDVLISKDTYTYDTSLIEGEWTAVRVYDYEFELNENKRNIYLVNHTYADRVEKELSDLLNA